MCLRRPNEYNESFVGMGWVSRRLQRHDERRRHDGQLRLLSRVARGEFEKEGGVVVYVIVAAGGAAKRETKVKEEEFVQ